jgi:hypothetical protein
MEQQLVTTLTEMYLRDLQKPEVDKFSRAGLIRTYLNDNNMSIRQFSKKFGLSYSTVEDWLLYNRISEEQYNEMISKGFTPLSIYRALRTKQGVVGLTDVDVFLVEMKKTVLGLRGKEPSPKTLVLIDDLVDALHRVSVDFKLKMKKGVKSKEVA